MSPSAFIWTASGGQHQPSGYASTGHSTAGQLAVYYNSAYSNPPDESHSRSSTLSFDNDFSDGRSFTRPKFTWPSYGTLPPYDSRIIEISGDYDDDEQPRPNSSVEYVPNSSPSPMSRPASQDDQQQLPARAGEYRHAIPSFSAADAQPRLIHSGPTPAAPPSSMTAAPSDTAEDWRFDSEWALQTIYDRCLRATKIYLSPAVASPSRLRHHGRRRRRHNPYRRRSTAVPAATPSLRENVWRIADLFWRRTRRDGAVRGADAGAAARMVSLLRAADAVVFGEDAACVAADAASLCDALGDREGSRLVLDVAAPWIDMPRVD